MPKATASVSREFHSTLVLSDPQSCVHHSADGPLLMMLWLNNFNFYVGEEV